MAASLTLTFTSYLSAFPRVGRITAPMVPFKAGWDLMPEMRTMQPVSIFIKGATAADATHVGFVHVALVSFLAAFTSLLLAFNMFTTTTTNKQTNTQTTQCSRRQHKRDSENQHIMVALRTGTTTTTNNTMFTTSA